MRKDSIESEMQTFKYLKSRLSFKMLHIVRFDIINLNIRRSHLIQEHSGLTLKYTHTYKKENYVVYLKKSMDCEHTTVYYTKAG